MDAIERARQLAQGGEQAGNLTKATPESPMDQRANPAERPGKSRADRQRVPMSVPVQKLAVPAIPGYHLHWFRGTPDRIARAQQAGYTFVDPSEVTINNVALGDSSVESGNMDLGSRVTVVAGSEVAPGNQPLQMILMKIPEEFWQQDQLVLEDRNEQIAATLRGGQIAVGQAGGERMGDAQQRYIPEQHRRQVQNLFTRKR